jgi:hypothetical protein
MKKSVRIRKAQPGETPGYRNKTKQFLQKARTGMSVDTSQQFESMYSDAYGQLMNETPADVVYYNLINNYGVNGDTASMVLESAFSRLVEEGHINPDMANQTQEEQSEGQPQDQDTNEEDLAEEQEQQELMMSEMDDDDSHIYNYSNEDDFDEEQMTDQAFQYGGYYQDGGYSQDPVLDQYDRAGNTGQQQPFSIEDLIQQQAGVQLFNPQGSQIGDYIGNYKPTQWSNQNWLAKKGGSVPKLPKYAGGGPTVLEKVTKPLTQGYNWYNRLPQFQNVSGISRAFPALSGMGYLGSKIPGVNWMLGLKNIKDPSSSVARNALELQQIMQSTSGYPTNRSGFSAHTGSDELSVNQLMFPTEALRNIAIHGNSDRGTFKLSEILEGEGTIGGIYGKDSRISLSIDDQGNRFFDISTKINPGDKTMFGVTSTDGTSAKFRNRIYYKPNADNTDYEFFDGLGNPLEGGSQSLYQVTRPIVPSFGSTMMRTMFSEPGNLLGTRGIFGQGYTGPGINDQSFLKNLVSRQDITSDPPLTFDQLGTGHKWRRGLEQLGYQYGTFPFGAISSAFGYNPLRTRSKNITETQFPVTGYTNPAIPTLSSPLQEGAQYAEDLNYRTNLFRRGGRNFLGGLLGLGGLGYYMFGPEGEEQPLLGPVRSLYPSDRTRFPLNQSYDTLNITPDSLEGFSGYPSERNYYRSFGDDTEMPDWDTIPENYKKGGKITKKKFTKQLLSFFDDGGENPNDPNTIGKGDRMKNEGKEKLDKFKLKMSEDSNKTFTGDIYDLAMKSGNEDVIRSLTENGVKENLAENTPQETPEAKWGMSMGNVPEWYSGHMNNMMSPREYRKLFKQLKRMMPRGVDISKAGYASSMMGLPNPEATLDYPGYASMFMNYAMNPFTAGYGMDPLLAAWAAQANSAQAQADEVERINNEKAIVQTLNNDVNIISNVIDDNLDDVMDAFTETEEYEDAFKQVGGFVDMNAETPLNKFFTGGVETNYYEPYDIPKAKRGRVVEDGDLSAYELELAKKYGINDPGFNPAGTERRIREMQRNEWIDAEMERGYGVGNQGFQLNQCPPGYQWSRQYNMCMPMAQIIPNYIKGPTTAGGLLGALLPFNRGKKGFWNKQMTLPYYAGSGNPYMGPLGPMVAKDVHKSGLFGGAKKWTEYYDPSGRGVTPEMIEAMQNNQGGGRRGGNKLIKKALKAYQKYGEECGPGGCFPSPGYDYSDNDVQDFGQSRKDERYQKYLGDQYGEDYWYGDRGEDPYEYQADFYANKGVPGTRSQKQLDKLYAKEDRSRLREARQDQRQYDRTMRRADRRQAQNIRRSRRSADFGYGGMPMAVNGFAMQDDFGADQGYSAPGYSNPFATRTEQMFNPSQFQGTPFQGMTIPGQGQWGSNRTVEQIQEDTQDDSINPGDDLVAIDKKRKKMWEVNPEQGNIKFNAFARGVANFFDPTKKWDCAPGTKWDETANGGKGGCTGMSSQDMYAASSSPLRGRWHDIGSFLGNFGDPGANTLGTSPVMSRYGGYMQQGGTHEMYNGLNMRNSDHKHYEEDEVVYMSPEEIEQYLAAGGQIEYL